MAEKTPEWDTDSVFGRVFVADAGAVLAGHLQRENRAQSRGHFLAVFPEPLPDAAVFALGAAVYAALRPAAVLYL